jgi:diguanylate cyclase
MAMMDAAVGSASSNTESLTSVSDRLGRVTISLGCATARKGDTVQSLIARADGCLYAAKRNGRNRVICETDPEIAAAAAAEAKVA